MASLPSPLEPRGSVVLSSGLTNYVFAAQKLHELGILSQFHTTYLRAEPISASHLPALRQITHTVNMTRLFPDAPMEKITRHPLSDVMAQVLQRTRLPAGYRHRITNSVFDRAVRRKLEESDVFHFVSGSGYLSSQKAKANGAFILCDRRATHHLHEYEEIRHEAQRCGVRYASPQKPIFTQIEKELDLSDAVIVGSEYARSTFLQRGFTPSRVLVARYGVDTATFSPASPPTPSSTKLRVLFAGTLDVRKGVRVLVGALKALQVPATLYVVGSCPPFAHRMLTAAHIDYVVHGRVSKAELVTHYRANDVLVLPSIVDSFGLVALEAMASGSLVVVSDACGAAELLDNGNNGYVTSSGGVLELALALEVIFHLDPTERARIETRARDTALRNDWSQYGWALHQAYLSIFTTFLK